MSSPRALSQLFNDDPDIQDIYAAVTCTLDLTTCSFVLCSLHYYCVSDLLEWLYRSNWCFHMEVTLSLHCVRT